MMKNEPVEIGKYVYNREGVVGEVVACTPHSVVVALIYEDCEEGMEMRGPLVQWSEWYTEPEKLNLKALENLKEADEKLAQANKDLRSLQNRKESLHYEIAQLEKTVEMYAPLKEAMRYCAEGVEYVVHTGTGRIEKFEQVDRYNAKTYRMLSLTAKPNGYGAKQRVGWFMNAYHDGSGGDTEVILCKDLAEATEIAQELVLKLLEQALAKVQGMLEAGKTKPLASAPVSEKDTWPGYLTVYRDLMAYAGTVNVPVPEELEAALYQARLAHAKAAEVQAKNSLADIASLVQALEGTKM